MASIRVIFVSFAILATVGLAFGGDLDPSSHSTRWMKAEATPEKAKKINDLMNKACTKPDFKEENVYEVRRCVNRGYHSFIHDCTEKVLGKIPTVLDKWKKQCSLSPEQKKENQKKIHDCYVEELKKFKEMSAEDKKAYFEKLFDDRIACLEKVTAWSQQLKQPIELD